MRTTWVFTTISFSHRVLVSALNLPIVDDILCLLESVPKTAQDWLSLSFMTGFGQKESYSLDLSGWKWGCIYFSDTALSMLLLGISDGFLTVNILSWEDDLKVFRDASSINLGGSQTSGSRNQNHHNFPKIIQNNLIYLFLMFKISTKEVNPQIEPLRLRWILTMNCNIKWSL